MISFLKSCGRGILYVIGLPFLIVYLALYTIFGFFVIIFMFFKSIIYFFMGKSLFGDLEEDIQAKKIISSLPTAQYYQPPMWQQPVIAQPVINPNNPYQNVMPPYQGTNTPPQQNPYQGANPYYGVPPQQPYQQNPYENSAQSNMNNTTPIPSETSERNSPTNPINQNEEKATSVYDNPNVNPELKERLRKMREKAVNPYFTNDNNDDDGGDDL